MNLCFCRLTSFLVYQLRCCIRRLSQIHAFCFFTFSNFSFQMKNVEIHLISTRIFNINPSLSDKSNCEGKAKKNISYSGKKVEDDAAIGSWGCVQSIRGPPTEIQTPLVKNPMALLNCRFARIDESHLHTNDEYNWGVYAEMHQKQMQIRSADHALEDFRLEYHLPATCRVVMHSAISDALVGRRRWSEGEVQDEMTVLLSSNEKAVENFLVSWWQMATHNARK